MDSPATTSSTYKLECPVSIKWTISEDKMMAAENSKDRTLKTELFNASNIPGVKYYLSIQPLTNLNVWIGFDTILEEEEEIRMDVNYTIDSAGYTTNEKDCNGSFKFFINYYEFYDPEKKFIVDGKFTLKCEGILSVQREKPAEIENGIKFDTGLVCHRLWMSYDKDFTINVDGTCVKAHKCFLNAQSPVFKAMSQSGIKESMVINDFSVRVVETAVQFCYLGETTNALNLKENMRLLEFCHKYEMNDVKTRIEASMILDVSVSNVCLLANCSINSKAVKLEEECFKLLIKSLKTTPVADIGLLDKDFAIKLLTKAFCNIIETS